MAEFFGENIPHYRDIFPFNIEDTSDDTLAEYGYGRLPSNNPKQPYGEKFELNEKSKQGQEFLYRKYMEDQAYQDSIYIEDEIDYYELLVKSFAPNGRITSESSYYADSVIEIWSDFNGKSLSKNEIAEVFLTRKAVFQKICENGNEDMAYKVMSYELTKEQIECFLW